MTGLVAMRRKSRRQSAQASSEQTRLLFVETTAEHPFAVTELMMPVLPVVRVANVADAIALAVKLACCHHTAAMHCAISKNMNQMANAIDTSIFVKNGPWYVGWLWGRLDHDDHHHANR